MGTRSFCFLLLVWAVVKISNVFAQLSIFGHRKLCTLLMIVVPAKQRPSCCCCCCCCSCCCRCCSCSCPPPPPSPPSSPCFQAQRSTAGKLCQLGWSKKREGGSLGALLLKVLRNEHICLYGMLWYRFFISTAFKGSVERGERDGGGRVRGGR